MLHNHETGYLASVVGLSASGKSTAIDGVRAILAGSNVSSASFHDRTSDPESAKLDHILHSLDLSPEARMHLIIAARRQIIDRRILPSLNQNDVTLTDRYYPCTIAYQAYGEGLDRERVSNTAISAAHDAIPDRIFVLDIPAETAIRRMALRGGEVQIFDAEKHAFHDGVRAGYLEQAAADERFEVVNGLAPREEVASFMAHVILEDLRSQP